MKDIVGIVFASILCLLAAWFWVWVVFKNGADVWKNSMIKWDKVIGGKTKEKDFFLNSVVLKSVCSIFLICSLFALCTAFSSFLD